MPDPKQTSSYEAYTFYLEEDPDRTDEEVKVLLRADGYDTADYSVQNYIRTKPVEPAIKQTATNADVQAAAGRAYERLIEKKVDPVVATNRVSNVKNADRTPDGEQSILPQLKGKGKNVEELIEQGASGVEIAAQSLVPQVIEDNSSFEARKKLAIKKSPELIAAYEAATTDEKYDAYAKKSNQGRVSLKYGTLMEPTESKKTWKWGIRKSEAHKEYDEYLNIIGLDPLEASGDIKESTTMALLRDLSFFGGSFLSIGDLTVRGGVEAVNELAVLSGWDSIEDYLSDQDSYFSPGFTKAKTAAILPSQIVENPNATVGQKAGAVVSANMVDGWGLFGAYKAGHKIDVLLGIKEPDEGASVGFNVGTLAGGVGGAFEMLSSLMLGTTGFALKGAALLRAIKQIEAAGLMTPAIKAALIAEHGAEARNALRVGLTKPVQVLGGRLLAKPLDFAAAKLFGKDLELASSLSRWAGAGYKPKDIRALSAVMFSSDPKNVKVGEYALTVMQLASRSADLANDIAKIEKTPDPGRLVRSLETFFKNTPGIGTFKEFKAALESIDVQLTDDLIRNFSKELINAEKIAAVKARQLANSLPKPAREALLGRNSPLDLALKSATKGNVEDTIKAKAQVGAALALRSESWLMVQANKRIEKAMNAGSWDLSYIERLSNTVFASPEVKAAAIKQVQNTIGKTIGELVGKAGSRGDDIVLSEKQKQELLNYFIGDFRGRGHIRSGTWIDQINNAPYSLSTKEVLLSASLSKDKPFKFTQRHIDALMDDALSLEASGRSISVSSVNTAIRTIESTATDTGIFGRVGAAATAPLRAMGATGRGRYLAEAYKQTFKASELEAGGIRNFYNAVKGEFTQKGYWTDSTVSEITKFIRDRASAGEEAYKYSIRTLRTQVNPRTGVNYTQEEAWATTILEEYKIAGEATRREIELARGKGLIDDLVDVTPQSHFENLFDDYLTLIYGGQENISATLLSSGGAATRDARALSPKNVGSVISAITEVSGDLKALKKSFAAKADAGDVEEAMGVLVLMHTHFKNTKLGDLIDGGSAGFKKILESGEGVDTGKILLKSGAKRVRNLTDGFDDIAHEVPYYDAENFSGLIGTIFSNKRLSNIIDDGIARLADAAGSNIYPSSRSLGLAVQADRPYRLWLISDILKMSGIASRPSDLIKNHLELTDLSIRRGVGEYISEQSIHSDTVVKWNKARRKAAEDIIGRTRPSPSDNKYGTVILAQQQKWDEELALIEDALDSAYIHDSKSPWKIYQSSIADNLKVDTKVKTPEYYKNLMWSLEKTYGRVGQTRRGVTGKSRMPGEISLDLPMIFDPAKAAHADLTSTINIERRGRGFEGKGIIDKFERTPFLDRIERSADVRSAGKELSIPTSTSAKGHDFADQMDEAGLIAVDDFISFFVKNAVNEARRTGSYQSSELVLELAETLSKIAETAGNAAYQSNRFAKGGVLGGFLLFNPKYLALNEVSAPFIIGQTVGGKYVDFMPYNASVVTAFAHGLVPQQAANVVATSTLTGKKYRVADVARLVTETSVSRGQASAELASNFAEGFIRYAGSLKDPTILKRYKAIVKSGQDAEAAIEKIMLTQPSHVQEVWHSVQRQFLTTGMNTFNQIASASDLRHRTGVFLKAIEFGKTEAEAIKLSQAALHDYNALSRFEKESVNKLIWFYTYSRSSIAVLMKNVIEHPTRVAVGAKLARGVPEDPDYVKRESYYSDRPFMGMLDGGVPLLGPRMPTAGAIYDLGGYLSPLANFFDPNQSMGAASLNTLKDAGVVLASKMPPFGKIPIGVILKKELKFNDVRDLSKYVDPSMYLMIQKSPAHKALFDSLVTLKAKPADRITEKNASFNGQVYELADEKSKMNYYLMLQAMLIAGHERTFRDWAPVALSAENKLDPDSRKYDYTPMKLGYDSPIIQTLTFLGITVPIERSGTTEQQDANETRVRELDKLE